MKKLLIVTTTAFLLTACAGTKQGAELYGTTQGGWKENVNITDLSPTVLTKNFKKTEADVVYFNFNQSTLDNQAKTILKQQANWLKQNPTALIVIEGRCDERGTREYNLALGDQRANAARNYLLAQGVEPTRIRTISYGKDKPVVLGSSEETWARNRNATTVAY